MEFGLFLTGIGGQGVQLVGKVLANAAVAEHRHVMLSGEYGGEMRGGSSRVTLVIGTERLHALPVAAAVDSVLVLHPKNWQASAERLRPGSLIVIDSIADDTMPETPGHNKIVVPASRLAQEAGNPMSMGLALLGAYAAITGLATTDSLVAAMKELVPSYRRQHVETNERAIRAGAAWAPALVAPAGLDAAPRAVAS